MKQHQCFATVIGIVLLLSGTVCSAAKLYKWVDDKGQVHYTDKIPADVAKKQRQELNSQGIVTKTTDRAKTPEELVAQRKADAEAAAAKKAQEEAVKADQALLQSYASEGDLTRAFTQRNELIEQQITGTNLDIANRQKNLDNLLSQAGSQERSGKPVSATLKQLIDGERNEIVNQKKYLATKQAEKVTALAEYQAKLKRYREVVARYATPAK
jgi:hypothetical protein